MVSSVYAYLMQIHANNHYCMFFPYLVNSHFLYLGYLFLCIWPFMDKEISDDFGVDIVVEEDVVLTQVCQCTVDICVSHMKYMKTWVG